MPRYEFKCDKCGAEGERYRSVAQRDCVEVCRHCARGPSMGLMKRVFVPSANISVPAHFRIEADWCLPDAGDTAGWDARQGGSQRHAPQVEDFASYFERTVKAFD